MKNILKPLISLGLLASLLAIPMAASAQDNGAYGHIGPRHVQEGWKKEGRMVRRHHRRHHRKMDGKASHKGFKKGDRTERMHRDRDKK